MQQETVGAVLSLVNMQISLEQLYQRFEFLIEKSDLNSLERTLLLEFLLTNNKQKQVLLCFILLNMYRQ